MRTRIWKRADNLECREVCERQEDNGCSGCPIAKAFDRLAAYENTGLEPDEIISLCDMDRRAKMAEMLRIEERYGKSIDRLKGGKVWRGELIIQQGEHKEYIKRCSKCGFPISGWWGADKFCTNCGAPMTDEAVDMVMKREEALHHDGKGV